MSPRPLQVDDGAIVAGALRAISRVGPSRLRLEDVAMEVGLSPGRLVQRFGSKRELLLAVARSGVCSPEDWIAAARTKSSSPLEAAINLATGMAQPDTTPQEVSNNLTFLQIDLTDPEFHALARKTIAACLEASKRLLDEAVARGELSACDTRALARALSAVASGSLLNWAVFRKDKAPDWVRADIAPLIDPLRPAPRRPTRRRGRGRSR